MVVGATLDTLHAKAVHGVMQDVTRDIAQISQVHAALYASFITTAVDEIRILGTMSCKSTVAVKQDALLYFGLAIFSTTSVEIETSVGEGAVVLLAGSGTCEELER